MSMPNGTKGSGSHHHGCDGDTVVLTFDTTTNQVVAYDENVTTGCRVAGQNRFVVIHACLLANDFRVTFAESTAPNRVTLIYVRC